MLGLKGGDGLPGRQGREGHSTLGTPGLHIGCWSTGIAPGLSKLPSCFCQDLVVVVNLASDERIINKQTCTEVVQHFSASARGFANLTGPSALVVFY